ncbi:endolytic transglycosylase MltG [bacterium]|nr:endolytic transglycosylase MltG [Porticoccaceae bacterium]MDB4322014.1 endolytic transglycosylase MltG [bacterium]MDB9724584.1 endolytic transglycosylase MltG [bacterium]MDB9951966.1 endolytic transglycosylase MltG [Porticoccaceae bacterium]MDC0003602.1 endolytic transglycosylase MltG [Porticoccaceae bacterium]
MIKPLLRITALCLLLLAIAGAWLLGFVHQHLDRPVNLAKESSIVWSIDSGSSLSLVTRQLYKDNIISHPRILSAYAKLSNRTSIQAGSYSIETTDSARTLLAKFNRGEVILHKVTFPEGWSFKQWLSHLAKIKQFSDIANSDPDQILAAAGLDLAHPEGWFFPDTYSYSATDSVSDILVQAHGQMQRILDRAWQAREDDLPYKTAYEALIMASIIEKETGVTYERPEIAGVFVRRLQRGMRLQTDPTVIYGMGDAYKGNIRRKHLKQLTAYNTYRINGLPPTPIAMPSAAAIEAALHPLPGSSLYFVARGDGSHYFSDSFAEHQSAVRRYQIKQRAQNYQSAPSKKQNSQ